MATQKNIKSSRASATKKSSKAAPKVPSKAKQTIKSASTSKSKASGKSIPASLTKKATKVAKKTAPVSKKPASKPVIVKKSPAKPVAPKSKTTSGKRALKVQAKPASASKAAPKSNLKAKAISPKSAKPISKFQSITPVAKKPNSGASIKAKEVIIRKTGPTPVIQSKLPKTVAKPAVQPKTQVTLNPQLKRIPDKPVFVAAKTALKPAGSKISDLAKPSVSSKPMTEKPKEIPKPKEFQRKSLKQSTVHSVKPFDTMSDKKENKPVGATYSDEPHKTRYNDKELEEFDQLIDQKLIVAREQLEFYLKQLEDMAENPDNKIKGLDDGLSTLESERVSSMAARQQKLIQHLENAKIRIKNKVYGICRETGRLISKERLRAVPHATLSIEAKQAQN